MWVKPVAVADGSLPAGRQVAGKGIETTRLHEIDKTEAVAVGSLPAGRQVAGKDNEFNVNIKISN
jgi:hypothetical protein